MYIVSSCLAGFRTRYDGGASADKDIIELVKNGKAIAICPEQLAGLGCPRAPISFNDCTGADVLDGKGTVSDSNGIDSSDILIKGAKEVLRIAQIYGVNKAILKDGSPSCGVTYIYSCSTRVKGRGITSEILSRNGIEISSVDSLK
jgi:uncharacterized protein YbbK (DUF523 family)